MDQYKNHPFYQEMNIDQLFQNAWEMIKKYYGWLFFYSFILMAVINTLTSSFLSGYMDDLSRLASDPGQIGPLLGNMFIFLIISVVGNTVLYAFLTLMLMNQDASKNHMSIFGESLTRFFIPLLVASIIAGLIFMLGAILGIFLLIIGALFAIVYFATIFFPISAIVINEGTDPIQTISRCFKLVHTDFWKSLGWVLLILVIYLVLSFILGAITMLPSAGSFFDILNQPEEALSSGTLMEGLNSPVQILLNSIANAALFPVFPIFGVLIYLHLKHQEDQVQDHSDLMDHLS
jgi:hypothetical protein